jgi:hypothetical protein
MNATTLETTPLKTSVKRTPGAPRADKKRHRKEPQRSDYRRLANIIAVIDDVEFLDAFKGCFSIRSTETPPKCMNSGLSLGSNCSSITQESPRSPRSPRSNPFGPSSVTNSPRDGSSRFDLMTGSVQSEGWSAYCLEFKPLDKFNPEGVLEEFRSGHNLTLTESELFDLIAKGDLSKDERPKKKPKL